MGFATPKENNMAKKLIESPTPSPDFVLIAQAIAFKTHDAVRNALRASNSLYVERVSEVAIGDLVANISDLTEGAGCLDCVGTVLEIRDGELEVRRVDGVTRCVIPAIGTYVAAKGDSNG